MRFRMRWICLDQVGAVRHLQRGAIQNEGTPVPARQSFAVAPQKMLHDAIGHFLSHLYRQRVPCIAIGSGMATHGSFADALVSRQQRARSLLNDLLHSRGQGCFGVQSL